MAVFRGEFGFPGEFGSALGHPPPPVIEQNLRGLVKQGFYGPDVLLATQPSVSKQ